MKDKWKLDDLYEADDHFWIAEIGKSAGDFPLINVMEDSKSKCAALAEKTIDALNNFEYEFENVNP